MTTPRARVVLATALALPLLLFASLFSATPAQAQTAGRYMDQARAATNVERVDRDMRRLRHGRCVQRYAMRQAARMARQQRMYHQDLGVVMRRCDLSAVGENVAYGYATGRAVVRAWMRSPGHRANILNRRYRLLGLAARRGADGHLYSAQVFGRH